ncbi:Very-long-chain 3-oxoacyl-CoA reductase 1 [Galdieria sulphuraria]|uniref:Beta-keto reductase n=1 Tax=Galdieria sulphuraria TaxID=130081 RepID=M2XA78_GALSU|nr:beta-keto reductase [Galdieria sulphuraria]EME26777.1 beta-keto reductase [Galdieria sulphuraria]GJD11259.1 Very-long-chain 3-oxoacyl-CoA reductase 1 [Galdieria sulphuraria]|eukprot:XP_005703297.1 beta-keto reductase [Galdieria sulphuraria]
MSVLSIIGALCSLYSIFFIIRFIYRHWFRTPFSWETYRGEWAVVTGASYGIGAAYAVELAKKGLNVILLARSVDKLQHVAQQVESKGAKSLVISFDFASASTEDWRRLENQLNSLTVSVLVNNVGVNVSLPTAFLEMEEEKMDQILRVNIVATQKMTRIVVPKMVERRKGIVLFLSSGGGVLSPAPYLSCYSGSKAYENALATALAGELESSGIIVQSITPFFVTSEMSKIRQSSLAVPSAERFARDSLQSVGYEVCSNPYWFHECISIVLSYLPLKLQIRYVAKLHRGLREKVLRKSVHKKE